MTPLPDSQNSCFSEVTGRGHIDAACFPRQHCNTAGPGHGSMLASAPQQKPFKEPLQSHAVPRLTKALLEANDRVHKLNTASASPTETPAASEQVCAPARPLQVQTPPRLKRKPLHLLVPDFQQLRLFAGPSVAKRTNIKLCGAHAFRMELRKRCLQLSSPTRARSTSLATKFGQKDTSQTQPPRRALHQPRPRARGADAQPCAEAPAQRSECLTPRHLPICQGSLAQGCLGDLCSTVLA